MTVMSKQLKTMKKMKTMKSIYYMALLVVCTLMTASCSNLDETLYDQVGTQNYYNTKCRNSVRHDNIKTMPARRRA